MRVTAVEHPDQAWVVVAEEVGQDADARPGRRGFDMREHARGPHRRRRIGELLQGAVELVDNAVWQRSIVNSLIIASSTTALATVLGTLAALGLRGRVPFAATLRTVFLLPMVVPAVVMGVGMQVLFVRGAFSAATSCSVSALVSRTLSMSMR